MGYVSVYCITGWWVYFELSFLYGTFVLVIGVPYNKRSKRNKYKTEHCINVKDIFYLKRKYIKVRDGGDRHGGDDHAHIHALKLPQTA